MEILKVCLLKKKAFGEKEIYELNLTTNKETIMNGAGCNVKDITPSKSRLKAEKLYEIAKKWDEKYINLTTLDGIEYTVIIEIKGRDWIKIHCRNKTPEDFSRFIETIKES